jgi:hypothetical protein
MNTDNTIHSDNNPETPSTLPTLEDLDFLPIDGKVLHWSEKFRISMLRIGRILLKKDAEVLRVSAERVSKLMTKHRNEIPAEYTGLEIREQVHLRIGEFTGGGVRVGWSEDRDKPYRSVPHYDFTFSRIYRPEELVVDMEPSHDEGHETIE